MPQNWKTYKLGEVADVQNGYAFKSKDLGERGIPVVKIKNIVPPNVLLDDADFYAGEIDSKLDKYLLKKGDFLISMTGSTVNVMSSAVGKMGRYRLAEKALLNQRAGKIYITEEEIADFNYLCHYLNRYEIHYDLALNATGSANQANISPAQIKDIDLLLPPLPIQQRIASILGALDDKIELNLEMNKTLEEMAMALYKHWFVDFGPFQDSNFVESELGMIPEGWEVVSLKSICEKISKGTTPRKHEVDGLEKEVPFLKVRDLSDDNTIKITALELIPRSVHLNQLKRSILKEDDIVFSIAGTIGRTAIIPKKLDDSNTNQALAFIRLLDKNKHRNFIFSWLKSDKIQNEIQTSIVQGVQANVSLGVIGDLKIILPDDCIFNNWKLSIDPIIELMISNREENMALVNLRDTLLPKLISGEVEVKEAEEEVSKVV